MKPLDYKGKSGIYKLTNSRGEFYIGSSKDLYRRFRSHKSMNTLNDDIKNVEVEIFEYTDDNLKEKEQNYINQFWSIKILNKEKVTKGRDIRGEKNPMFRIIPDIFCLNCSRQIMYHATKQPKRCKSCAAKLRKRDEVTKTFL